MRDLAVATGTLDMMTRHMELMHEWGIGVLFKLLRLVVTGVTALSRGLTIPLHYVEMTFLAPDIPLYHRLVIEDNRPQSDVARGRCMADSAAAEWVKFPCGLHPLEVAEVTGGRGDFDVGSYHDLRMTACTSELSSPAFLFQVRTVVKNDPALEGDLSLQQAGRVTT